MDVCVLGEYNYTQCVDVVICAMERHFRGSFHGHKGIPYFFDCEC